MKFGSAILAAVVGALVALGVAHVTEPSLYNGPSKPEVKETRLEQVKRTGKIRCGYVIWPPGIIKDANTGQMSGITYDIAEEIGKQLNVKIEWAGEVAPGQMASDLAFNRYDMICSAFLITPARARESDFSLPLFYHPTYIYARKDDTRFDNNYASANSPNVTFAEQDGDFSAIAATQYFPKAKTVAIPQIASSAEFFNIVASKKADLVVSEPFTFISYEKNNPGIVRQLQGPPVFVGAVSFPLPAKEYDLKNLIDESIIYLHGLGFIDSILKKYETPDLKFLRSVKPFTIETSVQKP